MTYEFVCRSCKATLAEQMTIAEYVDFMQDCGGRVQCPECKQPEMRRAWSPPGISIK